MNGTRNFLKRCKKKTIPKEKCKTIGTDQTWVETDGRRPPAQDFFAQAILELRILW
jgi:hypothetical protein